MNTLIALSYPDLDAAHRALAALAALRDAQTVALSGVVIVECARDGSRTAHAADPARVSHGSLLADAFARIDASRDALRDRPIDDALIERVARKVRAGTVTLAFAVTQLDVVRLSAALAPLGGDVLDTTLSLDDELKLVEAISKARDGAADAEPD
ncbi:DUF1269 domain-containing protein [Burkholderia multivorans]|uniref:DUF1269 domain-containing protein n=1 Tax=Burkholderia multivorans TaxID=87883 RepID=UPI002B24E101|nr:DUF1269 domain-containing protein [Burkholderia multivorans]MEB2488886.1 DUF1269 domain-containing protein [Burkholderia multivorans]MEB2571018.1 DUF1269 domain-containing protein [Burkholderia multivorans]